jgi:hypothetical protein
MTMHFGKFVGYEVEDLPDHYLTWLVEQDWIREPLASAILAELAARTVSPDEVKQVAREIVTTGYRTLAHRLHPDHGGTHQDMARLNAAKDWLEERAA